MPASVLGEARQKHRHVNGVAGQRPSTSIGHGSMVSSRSSPPSHSKHSKNKKQRHSFGVEASLTIQTALNELLSNPLRFEKSQMPSANVKYAPINDPSSSSATIHKPSQHRSGEVGPTSPSPRGEASTSDQTPVASGSQEPKLSRKTDLFVYKVPLTWPGSLARGGGGLANKGNTCYMNSVMQALLHTAPLVSLLLLYDSATLKGRFGGDIRRFDPVQALQSLTRRTFGIGNRAGNRINGGDYTSPREFTDNLQIIAKTFRVGRQEDAHEWLRLVLESIQDSCLALCSAKMKQTAIKETTFIHKVFGGKLRSRIHCSRCSYDSDTFESTLDLSLQISRCDSLSDAMSLFTMQEELKGSNKYRCEKCKQLVNARKQFTVEECPNVLTVHLKRFHATGAKISRSIAYPEKFRMRKEWMSDGAEGYTYHLYAIVYHFGSSPNSGHYIADVKGPNGKWTRMDDSIVSPVSGPSLNSKNAYLLFYVRDASDGLNNVIKAHGEKVKKPHPGQVSQSDAIRSPLMDSSATSVQRQISGIPNGAAGSTSGRVMSSPNGKEKASPEFLQGSKIVQRKSSIFSPIPANRFHGNGNGRLSLDGAEDLGETASADQGSTSHRRAISDVAQTGSHSGLTNSPKKRKADDSPVTKTMPSSPGHRPKFKNYEQSADNVVTPAAPSPPATALPRSEQEEDVERELGHLFSAKRLNRAGMSIKNAMKKKKMAKLL